MAELEISSHVTLSHFLLERLLSCVTQPREFMHARDETDAAAMRRAESLGAVSDRGKCALSAKGKWKEKNSGRDSECHRERAGCPADPASTSTLERRSPSQASLVQLSETWKRQAVSLSNMNLVL